MKNSTLLKFAFSFSFIILGTFITSAQSGGPPPVGLITKISCGSDIKSNAVHIDETKVCGESSQPSMEDATATYFANVSSHISATFSEAKYKCKPCQFPVGDKCDIHYDYPELGDMGTPTSDPTDPNCWVFASDHFKVTIRCDACITVIPDSIPPDTTGPGRELLRTLLPQVPTGQLIVSSSISPNPVSGIMNVSLYVTQDISNTLLIAVDLSGREQVIHQIGNITEGEHQYTISTQSMASGLYYIKLKTERANISIGKIVKQ